MLEGTWTLHDPGWAWQLYWHPKLCEVALPLAQPPAVPRSLAPGAQNIEQGGHPSYSHFSFIGDYKIQEAESACHMLLAHSVFPLRVPHGQRGRGLAEVGTPRLLLPFAMGFFLEEHSSCCGGYEEAFWERNISNGTKTGTTELNLLHCSSGEALAWPHTCLQRASKHIWGHKHCDLEDVLAQEDFVGELAHLQLHLQRGWPCHGAGEQKLPRVPVRAPHGENALAPATRDGKAQAVTHQAGGGHLEEHTGDGAIGLERQVVEGDGAGSQLAGSAVHGAGVPLALAARREGMPLLSDVVWLSGSCPHPCLQAQPVPQAAPPAPLLVLWQSNP